MTREQLEVADILKSFLLSSFRFRVFVPFFQRKSCKPSYQTSAQDRTHSTGRGGAWSSGLRRVSNLHSLFAWCG